MYYGDDLTYSDGSLSARRAWIEISTYVARLPRAQVALRKESVDRNDRFQVAVHCDTVALRKESVDRNYSVILLLMGNLLSLSARRAWIEI